MDRKLLTWVLLTALVVRVIAFTAASRGAFLIGEGRMQEELAKNLMEGRGFMITRSIFYPEEDRRQSPLFEFYRRVDGFYGGMRPETPTTFLVPGYAIFMAAVFAVFGTGNFLAVRGIQLLLGLLTVFLGLRLASRFLSGRYLWAAGLFFALDPFEIYYEAIPATQALFSLLFLLALLMSLRLIEHHGSIRRMLLHSTATGAAWAAAFYVRPAALPLMVWMILLLPFIPLLDRVFSRGSRPAGRSLRKDIFSIRGVASGCAVLVVFMILMLPWGLRNLSICGSFRIMPTQGGVNMWEYNGRIFTEHFEGERHGAMLLYGDLRDELLGSLDSPELAEFPEFRDEPEWVRDDILFRRNISFMAANPVMTLRLISLRFVEFFKPIPLNRFSLVFIAAGIISMFWLLFFLWGGAVVAAKSFGTVGLYIATGTAGYALMHILTASGTPHRVAVDFPMAILALIGVRYSVNRYSARRRIDASR